METLGYSRTITLVLTCPPYLLAATVGIVIAWTSGRWNERTWHITICNTFGNVASVYTPYIWPKSDGPRYLKAWMASIAFSIGVIVIAWAMRITLQRQNKKMRRDHPELTNFYVY